MLLGVELMESFCSLGLLSRKKNSKQLKTKSEYCVFCIILHVSEGFTSSPVLIDVLSFKLLNCSPKVKPVVSLKENEIKSIRRRECFT